MQALDPWSSAGPKQQPSKPSPITSHRLSGVQVDQQGQLVVGSPVQVLRSTVAHYLSPVASPPRRRRRRHLGSPRLRLGLVALYELELVFLSASNTLSEQTS